MTISPERAVDFSSSLASRVRNMSASVIREMLKVTQQPNVINFGGGLPAPELFPIEEVRAATGAALDRYGPAALQYSTTEGHPALREWIAAGARIPVSNVQITTGSQQALDLIGKVLIDEGDTVIVEAPTYLGALQCFQPYQPSYVQVPIDDQGMDVEALAEVLKDSRAKLLYAIPNFQNPTGQTMSLARRRTLVELTARHGVLIVEDDPYGRLRFSGEHLPSLYELGQELWGNADANHVIYCSSFSKTLMPGLRTAWIQAPQAILQRVIMAKQGADLHTPTLTQMIIAELLPEVLPRQIETVKAAYRERSGVMVESLREALPGEAQFTVPQGGMFLWVTLPAGTDTAALLPRAVERKVAFVPGSPFFARGGGQNTMRLSYSSATPQQIRTGIAALGETVHAALR